VIVAAPVAPVFTNPVEELIDATEILLLTHVPPPTLLVNVVVSPWHTLNVPEIVAGIGFTVNTAETVQPPAGDVQMIVELPAPIAVTLPPALIVATAMLLLLHDTPASVLVSNEVLPAHALSVPPIAEGDE